MQIISFYHSSKDSFVKLCRTLMQEKQINGLAKEKVVQFNVYAISSVCVFYFYAIKSSWTIDLVKSSWASLWTGSVTVCACIYVLSARV